MPGQQILWILYIVLGQSMTLISGVSEHLGPEEPGTIGLTS